MNLNELIKKAVSLQEQGYGGLKITTNSGEYYPEDVKVEEFSNERIGKVIEINII